MEDVNVSKRPNQIDDDVVNSRDELRDKSRRDGDPELTRENATLKENLAAAKRNEEIANSKRVELATQNFTLKGELEDTRKREEIANGMRDELTRENATLKENLAAAKRNEEIAKSMHIELTRENATLKDKLATKSRDDLEREISALKRELEDTKINMNMRTEKLSRESICRGNDHNHSRTNADDIFQLCCPNSCTSISLDSAIKQLSIAKSIDWKFYEGSDWSSRVNCNLCWKKLKKWFVIEHFLSPEHIEKVRIRGSGVLKSPVEHWLAEAKRAMSSKVHALDYRGGRKFGGDYADFADEYGTQRDHRRTRRIQKDNNANGWW